MKTTQKIKKSTIAMIMILLLIVLTSAQTTQTNPENATYAPNQNYEFILIEDLQDKVMFKLFENEIILLEQTNVNYEEGYYLVNIDDLSAGTYNYEWTILNETNTTNITTETITNNYEIKKAEPKITLRINSQTNNITINQIDIVNITATTETEQGHLELLINNELMNTTEILEDTEGIRTISIIGRPDKTGTYEVKARYNETSNYTYKEKTIHVIVEETSIEEILIIETNKEKYNLGETGNYYLYAPLNTTLEIEICKKDTTNPGFIKCYGKEQKIINLETATLEKDGKRWKSIILDKTLKPEIHEIRAKILNTNITTTKTYEVLNSMKLSVSGKTKLKLNEETTLTATTTGGIAPYTYTWTLPDGTTKTGTELKIKYATEGYRDIKINVRDKEGNTQEETITLDVRPYYDLTIEVRNQQNQVLKDVIVTITETNEDKITDSTGKVKFNLAKDTYKVRIDAIGYKLKTETIDLDATTSLTTKLDKIETTTTNNNKIELEKPTNKATITNTEIEFQAKVNLVETSTCKLFITDKNSQWFIELARKENVQPGTITFKEKIETGEYKWKISCETQKETVESEIREFSKSTTQFSTTTTQNTIDAGELRRQIEQAHENLDNLGLEERKTADALDIKETLRISLRDYERILRDLNSLALRRDLTDQQKQEKIQEYKEQVIQLESATPLLIEVVESEEYMAHASKEDLELIVKEYAEKRNIQGRPDLREIENQQNLIRTRTFTAQTTITYINGETEDITVVQKTIEYTGETTRHHFLLEKINEEINTELTTKQVHDVLTRNKLIRFEKPEIITYYLQGHQDLEKIKNSHTIILTEGSFRTSGSGSNTITGLVTFTNVKLEPITSLIIILILLILAYVFYAFDLKEKIIDQINNFSKDKKIKQLQSLINDAKDYLETKEIERASLIYKEIKMIYEKAPRNVKKEVYEDAITLMNILNEKYIEQLINQIQTGIKEKNKEHAIETYNKLTDAYNKSETNTQIKFKEQIKKITEEIKKQ
jgi:hypothetical protein